MKTKKEQIDLDIILWAYKNIKVELYSKNAEISSKAKSKLEEWINDRDLELIAEKSNKSKSQEYISEKELILKNAVGVLEGKPQIQSSKEEKLKRLTELILYTKMTEFAKHLDELINEDIINENIKKHDVAAIAFIFYSSGWINRKKCLTFKHWKSVFYDYFNRETDSFRENKLRIPVEKIKIKYPFLDIAQIKPTL